MTVRKSWRCFFSYIMAMVTKLHVNGTHWAIRPSLALVCEHLCAPAWPDAWSSRLSSPSPTSRQCSVMNGKVYAIFRSRWTRCHPLCPSLGTARAPARTSKRTAVKCHVSSIFEMCGLALAALSAVLVLAGAVYVLDPSTADLVYDGHGALSAGASSRLLYDYEEPYRTQARSRIS